MRAVSLILMLAAFSPFAAPRAQASPVPKCELKAMETLFAQAEYGIRNGDVDGIGCEKIAGGAHAFTVCTVTVKQDSDAAYAVTMDFGCDVVKGVSRQIKERSGDQR
jgi:hypothetical protein